MRQLFLIAFLPLFSIPMTAQPTSFGNTPYAGLNAFLKTDFMKKYEESRTKAEKSIADFIQIRDEFSEEDVTKVMDAYNKSAEKFNEVIYNIKADLLDVKKRKFIVSYPQDYARQIETELNEAKDFYSANYQAELLRVTDGRISGTPLLALLPEIIKYGKMAFQVFQSVKAEFKKYNETLLEQNLIQPFRFHSWNELEK